MKVKNNTRMYLITKIESEEKYIDTNGCTYLCLSERQKQLLNNKYFFEIYEEKNIKKLLVNKINIEVQDDEMIFNENVILEFIYNGKEFICPEDLNNLAEIYNKSLNPEIFTSYVYSIIKDKDYYNEFLNWTIYEKNKKSNMNDQLYVLILRVFVQRYDRIFEILLKKNLKKSLHDFLLFCQNDKLEEEQGSLLKLIECFEEEFFSTESNYVKNHENSIELSKNLLNSYGKENLDSILKFIKTMNEFDKQSKENHDLIFERITEILINLCKIKNFIPESSFNDNVNYLIKTLFKHYEDRLNITGFLNLSKTWLDYFSMKEDIDENYPVLLKKKHDEVSRLLQNELDKVSKERERYIISHFNESVKKYKWLEKNSEDYIIRTPKNSEEMIEIGKRMNICVGSYAYAVSSKKTKVLWLCTKEDEAIVAIEVNNKDQIVQAKTKNNGYPKGMVEEFIKNWSKEKMLQIISY